MSGKDVVNEMSQQLQSRVASNGVTKCVNIGTGNYTFCYAVTHM